MRLIRLLPRFRQAPAAVAAMAERENWPRARIQTWQLEAINAAWRHAVRHVPYYRRLREELALPDAFASIEEYTARAPILERDQLRRRARELLSERPRPGRWARTGGSTGQPTPVYWERERHLLTMRSQYRCRQIWGIDCFARTAMLWGHSASFAPGLAGLAAKLRLPLEDALRGRLRLSAYRLHPRDLEEHLDRLERFRPVMLYAYSSAAHLLALAQRARPRRLDSLKAVMLTSEPLFPDMAAVIKDAFGAPALREYGAAETGVIACDDLQLRMKVREDVLFVETLPAAGGLWRIVVTVLHNHSFPLLRYDIGDLSDQPLQALPTGFAALGNIIGRGNDFIVSRAGRLVHSEGLTHVVKYAAGVERFRAHQAADGEVEVMVEGGTITAAALETAARKLSGLLDGQVVRMTRTERIPPTVGGKHRWITSDAAPGTLAAPGAEKRAVAREPVQVEA